MRSFGWKPTRLQELYLLSIIEKWFEDEVITIHHVTDEVGRCQVELERRSASLGITFHRLIL